MKKKISQKKKKGSIKRLLIANAIATLALVTVSVTVLWALGLLGSIFAIAGYLLFRKKYFKDGYVPFGTFLGIAVYITYMLLWIRI